jgi:hypothetical protein
MLKFSIYHIKYSYYSEKNVGNLFFPEPLVFIYIYEPNFYISPNSIIIIIWYIVGTDSLVSKMKELVNFSYSFNLIH